MNSIILSIKTKYKYIDSSILSDQFLIRNKILSMKTTKRKDWRMIKKFCNWIDKESPVFQEWLDYGFDDVVFLSAHAKRVGIRKKTAWEASRKFLKCRNWKILSKLTLSWYS